MSQLLLLLLVTGQVLAQTILYVKPGGTGNGSSWANASGNLQAMIDAGTNGDQVWVAAGTYKPTTGTDRTISFSMKEGVAIYGGFAGTETSLSQRPAINPVTGQPSSSTLSGDIGTVNDAEDNSYHVIKNASGLTAAAILDGFVITKGNANNSGAFLDQVGSGVFNDGYFHFCNPTFRNCSFHSNSAKYGGAIYNEGTGGNSSPKLINCLFHSNSAEYGGAICNQGSFGNSNPQLTNCIFQGNFSQLGGAIFNDGRSSGISSPQLINCIFQSNSAQRGGAIHNEGTGGNSSPKLINCLFHSNSAGYGGAMHNYGATSGNSSPQLTNCTFKNNSSYLGQVMYNTGSFSGNSKPKLTNSLLWNNGGSNSYYNDNASITITYSLFEPSSTVTGVDISGPGNLTTSTSPFISENSVALNPCSPAINAGDPATTSALVGSTDLAGNPRFFNNGRIDMGAVELQADLVGITQQPASPSLVCESSTVTASVSVSGTGPFTYQWYKNDFNTPVTGQTTATLTLANVSTANTGSYSVVVTGACSVTSAAVSVSVTSSSPDYAALVDLYNATNGAGWTNKTGWLTSCDVCGWYGITCANGRVTVIDIANNNLTGTLPQSLSSLTSLQRLRLSFNKIGGTLPPNLGSITSLTGLLLSNNQFTGTIPESLTALTNLQALFLSGNKLTGTIPAGIGRLSNMKELYMDGNQLTGGIPDSFSALTNLQRLVLAGNPLGGPLPGWIGSLTALIQIEAGGCQLTGSLPASLTTLPNLNRLWLFSNQLSGALLPGLAGMPKLKDIWMSGNQFTGCFPSSYTALCTTNLINLNPFRNNPGLPGGGDFAAFCATGAGSDALQLTLPVTSLTACIANRISVSASASVNCSYNGPVSLSWVAPAGVQLSSTTANAVSVSIVSSGVYTLTAIATDGQSVVSKTVQIHAGPPVSVSLLLSSTVLTCNSPSGGASAMPSLPVLTLSYRWSDGNTDPERIVNGPGVYSVTVTTPFGCTATASGEFTTELAKYQVGASGLLSGAGSSVTVTARLATATSYTIAGPNGFSSVNTTGQFTVSEVGRYVVFALSTSGCVVYKDVAVLSSIPAVAPGDFQANDMLTCPQGDQPQQTAGLSAIATGNQFVFKGPDGFVQSNVYRQSGTYNVAANGISQPGAYTLVVFQNGVQTGNYTQSISSTCTSATATGNRSVQAAPASLRVTLDNTLTTGEEVGIAVEGAAGLPLRFQVISPNGSITDEQSVAVAGSIERTSLRFGTQKGSFLINVILPAYTKTIWIAR